MPNLTGDMLFIDKKKPTSVPMVCVSRLGWEGGLTAKPGKTPKLGHLDRKEIAALVGVAPMNRDSGRKHGYRKTKGGRPEVRSALYMSALTGIRHNPILKAQYDHLVRRGKEKKVAITACMRKMLTILNAILRDQQPFRLAATS